MTMTRFSLAILPLLALTLACKSGSDSAKDGAVRAALAEVSNPLAFEGSAYQVAVATPLPAAEPAEYDGLQNVFSLGSSIVSGSEPHGDAALKKLQEMGIRTIISVDGKAAKAAKAAELGMRYVHIPIQYRGINQDEMARLAKTFRDLDGPFYVHCFHGKHRGPAAAAVGRLVIDGAPRETAIAEMCQYSGTSEKYEGLYRVIATAEVPTADQTGALAYEFDSVESLGGVAGAMVTISRAHDHLKDLGKSDFAVDPSHPDLTPSREAQNMAEAFAKATALDEVKHGDREYFDWFQSATDESARLVEALKRKGSAQAADHFKAVRKLCSDCHADYRN